MEPSAVAARRTRASLALAVVGAIVLMTGAALVLAGEAVKLEHQARPPSLIGPGLVLAFLGLALGASAAVTILLDAPTRLPAAHPLAAAEPAGPSAFGPPPAGPSAFGPSAFGPSAFGPSAFGPPPAGPSAFGPSPAGPSPAGPPPAGPPLTGPAVHGEVVTGEVLSSARLPDPVPPAAPSWTEVVPGAALSPPGRRGGHGRAFVGPAPAEAPAAGSPVPDLAAPGLAEPGSAAPGLVPGAREPAAGEAPGYSDAGWDAEADGKTWPDPPPEPPQEIHHPVRR